MSQFANEYDLVDEAMHLENPDYFHIPHRLMKISDAGAIRGSQIDSPRFSTHPDAAESCTCPVCNGEATKPIIGHPFPLTPVNIELDQFHRVVGVRNFGSRFWHEMGSSFKAELITGA